ncbi:uncharacterized protein VTP21DRAFT_5769 [Calcarisporiella thermophila]|uniref:uncharacterized protein n=1 Tax=Calcarisporiella thermophila TaxID=911321 RepID=UPI0037448E4A
MVVIRLWSAFRTAITDLSRLSRPPVDPSLQLTQKSKWSRYGPFFWEYLMYITVGSEALHLMWVKMEYNEYREKMKIRADVLNEVVQRLERDEELGELEQHEAMRGILSGNGKIDDEELFWERLIAAADARIVAEKVQSSQAAPAETLETPTKIESAPKSTLIPSDTPASKSKPFFL